MAFYSRGVSRRVSLKNYAGALYVRVPDRESGCFQSPGLVEPGPDCAGYQLPALGGPLQPAEVRRGVLWLLVHQHRLARIHLLLVRHLTNRTAISPG